MTSDKKKKKAPQDSFPYISVRGAKVHNLKNIDVDIPRHQITVITGLSGSGKSSLAFDTILAEGQRRYIDTFSAYARSFIAGGGMERPDVESIEGLSPIVSIDQKSSSGNPRSTVGTITEIYDFLRLLFARVATPYSYLTNQPMTRYTPEQVVAYVQKEYHGCTIEILAPVVRDRKGHYRELLEQYRKRGHLQAYLDGELKDLVPGLKLNRYHTHYIAILIDKLTVGPDNNERVADALHLAMKTADGMVDIRNRKTGEQQHLSRKLMDSQNGLSYPDPTPADFSFNSPRGYCSRCKGLGTIFHIDQDKLFPAPNLSIADGAIAPLGKYKKNAVFGYILEILEEHEADLHTPLKDLPEDVIDEITYGSPQRPIDSEGNGFPGIATHIASLAEEEDAPATVRRWAEQYMSQVVCPECGGTRLSQIARSYRLGDYSLPDLCALELDFLGEALQESCAHLTPNLKQAADLILKEILVRTQFLIDVGVGYLSLGRGATTLSGGESQRIRLATQIGTGLEEVLYILDEPGIGLHPRDNRKLIQSLRTLCQARNTILVVEHDKEMMLAADHIIDMGPGAGRLGGHVVFEGSPKDIKNGNSLTTDYLTGKKYIPVPKQVRQPNPKRMVHLYGASGNNLKNVHLALPLGLFVVITGVSGSGKSSLINGTLVPILTRKLYRTLQEPLPYERVEGTELIDKVAVVNQLPPGKTPRSTPATYTGLLTDIRKIFALVPESKARGYDMSRFSFNVSGGRCAECKGNGYRTMSMNFLPDVSVPCHVCNGKRYNRETLEIRYKGKSIADVLEMTINQATEFFDQVPSLHHKLQLLQRVGLGYIKLGQRSSTLSGGESQRVKLSTELARRDTGKTLYVLDEPTTGLHFQDISVLLKIIQSLVSRGNTVVVIEHNLDIIKSADYIIDMGPEGGKNGGQLLFAGSPREMVAAAQNSQSYTAQFLQEEFNEMKALGVL